MSADDPTRDARGDEDVRDLKAHFFDLSIDLLCFLDFGGRFARLNPAWETTLGFTREELMAQPFIEFVHPDDRERTLQQNREVRRGGQAVCFENRYRCEDGSYKWFLWNATADVGRQVIYGIARDITLRKRAEQEREQLVEQLQSALAEVSTLRGFLPICPYCKRVRGDHDYWQSVEAYISAHTGARFSQYVCPDCQAGLAASKPDAPNT